MTRKAKALSGRPAQVAVVLAAAIQAPSDSATAGALDLHHVSQDRRAGIVQTANAPSELGPMGRSEDFDSSTARPSDRDGLFADPVLDRIANGKAVLRVGDRGPAVVALREGLIAMDYLQPDAFDPTLGDAVVAFQGQANLTKNGMVDRPTLAALEANVPLASTPLIERVRRGDTRINEDEHNQEPAVGEIRRALIALGYLDPPDVFDDGLKHAVADFQYDTGEIGDGVLGRRTLAKLRDHAPAPGESFVRTFNYDALYAGDRLDVTVGVGFDETKGFGHVRDGFIASLTRPREDFGSGFARVDVASLANGDRERLGLTERRYDPNAEYYHREFIDQKTGRSMQVVVRLVAANEDGSNGAQTRASFVQGAQQDDVYLVLGHARYGTGPDFDDIAEAEGNVVLSHRGNVRHDRAPAKLLSAIRDTENAVRELTTLDGPEYQVGAFFGCSTEEYRRSFSPAKLGDRSEDSLDLIVTTDVGIDQTMVDQARGLLDDLMNRTSVRTTLKNRNRFEALLGAPFAGLDYATRARQHFVSFGTLDAINRQGS